MSLLTGIMLCLLLTAECCDLERDSIQRINRRSLQEHVRCHKLSLAGNSITSIANDSFSGIGTSLETLDLQSNLLINITCGMFNGIPELNKLILSKNIISRIEDLSFMQLRYLAELNLEYNYIVRIGQNTFRGLTELSSLQMRSNEITEIAPDSFRRLPSLKELDMSGNNLFKLDSDTFTGLRSIKVIKLSGNNLQKINPGAFSFLPALEELFLHNNNLTSLQSNFFYQGRPTTLQMSLDKNPLKCTDNRLCWIKQASWLKFMTVPTDGSPTCNDTTEPWSQASTKICSNGMLFTTLIFLSM